MEKSNIVNFGSRDAISDPLTEILQKGAQDLIKLAVEAELEAYLAPFMLARTQTGHAAVVRKVLSQSELEKRVVA